MRSPLHALRTALAAAPLALLLLAGCDTGEVPDPSACNNGLSGFVTATVDGQAFAADCRTSALAGGDFTLTGYRVIEGTEGRVRHTITLALPDFATGPFTIGSDAAATYEVTDLDSGTTRRYVGESGEVFVEQAARQNPSGTFAFTARDGDATVTVTDGLFDVYE